MVLDSASIVPQEAEKNQLVASALWYAQAGYSVIPLQPGGRKPLIEWQKYQGERETGAKIMVWWRKWPDANIGIVTGKVSGVIVLDIDGPEGEKTLKDKDFRCSPTLVSRTGGGGWHYYYKHPGGVCRNFVGQAGETLLPGVDLRADGGYVVTPPSIHPTGNPYEWAIDPDAPPAELPGWLLELAKQQGDGKKLTPEEWGRNVQEGQRNKHLTRLAGSLLTKMPPGDALTMLCAWNKARCRPPLSEEEVRGVIESVAKREMEKEPVWPDPEPIEATLLPVESLPPEIIPGPFRQWAVDVAHRMQCPLDFMAIAVMVTVGAVIGAGCGIRPKRKDDWLIVPNLWGGVIGRPGTLKTPALQEAMKPLSQLESEAKRQYDDALTYFEAEKELFKAQRDALKTEMSQAAKGKGVKGLDDLKYEYMNLEPPEGPTWKRHKTNDATIEKMGELLQQNFRGILLFRDELIGLLTSWDKEGREPDRAFYLEAWNGYGSMTSDRIGRGTVHVNNVCVSILGGIQPAKLLAYLYRR